MNDETYLINKKGFTIPELLATIVIIGVLTLVATASYNSISFTVKQKTLENKLNLIKEKALEYAADNELDDTTISVSKLISEGYLDMENNVDTNEKIENPMGGYLDCYHIDIKRDIAEYSADIYESNDCSLANLDNLSSLIKIYVYKEDGMTPLGSNLDVAWSNSNVYLYLDSSTIDSSLLNSEMTITWKINGNEDKKTGYLADNVTTDVRYANIKKIEASLILKATVTATIETSSGNLSQSVNVLIDKEKPNLELNADSGYNKSSKKINFIGNDGNGSGLAEYAYYLTDDSTKVPTAEEFNIKATDENYTYVYENTKYYAYAIDKVGNISYVNTIDVTNIDYSNPVCSTPVDNPTWKTSYTYSYGCRSDIGTGCKEKEKTKTINEDKLIDNISWQIEDNSGNTNTCNASVRVNVDATPPTCNIVVSSGTMGNNGWYISNVSFRLTTYDALSGVASYGIGTSPTPTYNGYTRATLTYDTSRSGVTYYGYVKDVAGNTNTCSVTVKRLATRPTCYIRANGTQGYYGWYRSTVFVSTQSSSPYILGLYLYKNGTRQSRNTYTVKTDTRGMSFSGMVTNEAGLSGSCSGTVKRDTGLPSARLSVETAKDCQYNKYRDCKKRGGFLWLECKEWGSWYYKYECKTVTGQKDVVLTCSDSYSGIADEYINGHYGTRVRVSTSESMTIYGVCVDYAGNEASTKKTATHTTTTKTCTKSGDCNDTHIEVTNCEDGKNYTTVNGDNCGGKNSNGEYYADGVSKPCEWTSGGNGTAAGEDCGHVNEVCDSWDDDEEYECGTEESWGLN